MNPKYYELSRVSQHWEAASKWMVTRKEIDFSHRSIPAIFRAMAILKEKKKSWDSPYPSQALNSRAKFKATSMQDDMGEWEFDLVQEFISSLRTSIRQEKWYSNQIWTLIIIIGFIAAINIIVKRISARH